MLLTRRRFFSLLAAPAIVSAANIMPVVRALTWLLPVIYGDGLHDDWAGLDALMRGAPVDIRTPSVREVDGQIYISRGLLRISREWKVLKPLTMVSSHMTVPEGATALDVAAGKTVRMVENWFTTPSFEAERLSIAMPNSRGDPQALDELRRSTYF